jgi:hypothetical protein
VFYYTEGNGFSDELGAQIPTIMMAGETVEVKVAVARNTENQFRPESSNSNVLNVVWQEINRTSTHTHFIYTVRALRPGNAVARIRRNNGIAFQSRSIRLINSGRIINIPNTVFGTLNGIQKTLFPRINWGGPGGGKYPIGVNKENGKYKVAVGPKFANPNYPDNGRLWTDYDGLRKGIEFSVTLKHRTTGEHKIIECVIDDWKAHTYNKYPDGHAFNTGDIASFNVENGIIQTGIAYPNSWNAGGVLACSPEHMESLHVIEFCGHSVDFRVNDYELERVIIKD